jgi:hypothetical protein
MSILTRFASLTPHRKIFFGTALFFVFLCVYGLVQLPHKSRARLQGMMQEAGFNVTSIGSVYYRPDYMLVQNIKLDKYGYDEIKALRVYLNWPAFLFAGRIKSLSAEGVHLARPEGTVETAMRQLVQKLLDIPFYRITVSGLTLDLGTALGELRIEGDISLNTDNDPKNRDIKANLKAEQYQLGFESSWEGALQENGTLALNASVLDGRINTGALRISRFTGWVDLSAGLDNATVQTQMEAGSASLMGVPLQNLSLTYETQNKNENLIFRAGVSGLLNALITADYLKTGEDQMFQATLKGESLSDFLRHVSTETGHDNPVGQAIDKDEPFEIRMTLQPERRFPKGPEPFNLVMNIDEQKKVEGNLLFYLQTMQMRGSLETNAEMSAALGKYFKIPQNNITENFIRVDTNLSPLFKPESYVEKEKD